MALFYPTLLSGYIFMYLFYAGFGQACSHGTDSISLPLPAWPYDIFTCFICISMQAFGQAYSHGTDSISLPLPVWLYGVIFLYDCVRHSRVRSVSVTSCKAYVYLCV